MLAKVRPLLFWISKDDVGGARVSWRGDADGAFGLDLLIGSDPARAPRQINRWGRELVSLAHREERDRQPRPA